MKVLQLSGDRGRSKICCAPLLWPRGEILKNMFGSHRSRVKPYVDPVLSPDLIVVVCVTHTCVCRVSGGDDTARLI